jgi:hypothetical protein
MGCESGHIRGDGDPIKDVERAKKRILESAGSDRLLSPEHFAKIGRTLGFRRMSEWMASMVPQDRRLLDGRNFLRVSGDARCSLCRLEYFEHPPAPEGMDLAILCTGKRVKVV